MKFMFSLAGIPLFAALMVLLIQASDPVGLTIRPPRRAQVVSAPPLQSDLVLSARINLSAFRDDLDSATSQPIPFSDRRGGCLHINTIFFGRVPIGCSWNGVVTRRAVPTISGSGDRLSIAIPLHVNVRARTEGGLGPGPWVTATGDFTATAQATPKLNRDWSLSLNLSTDHRWDRELAMRVLGFRVPLGDVGGSAVRDELARLAADLESTVRDLDVRAHAHATWNSLHEPFQLSTDPEIWLRLRPMEVRFSGMHIDNDILHASTSITITTEGVFGERPAAFPTSPLPSVEERSQGDDSFVARLPFVLRYDALEAKLRDILRTQERWAPIPDHPDTYLTVHDVEVYPSDDTLAVGLHFTADVAGRWLDARGSVYLQGRPVVDGNQRIVSVDVLELTPATDNDLADLALVLFNDRIRSELARALTYSFGADYDRLLAAASSALDRSIAPNVTSQGELNYANVTGIVMGGRGLRLNVLSAGTLRLNVEL